ncbi:MAG: hypothetical protein A3J74_11225 [Elusimicrobia bacterium RIFCSPHIGHO2_02_FULL_57_9]|nr:MAG: hypothetical protein A3J74_11225 [Elusimicrobia bacterium RIFCSPHIGHO2_02_FULL_57_9]
MKWLLWLSAGLASAAPNFAPLVSQRLQTGKEAFEAGNYPSALNHFFSVIELAPENIEAKTYITRIAESWRGLESRAVMTRAERKQGLAQAHDYLDRKNRAMAALSSELEAVRRQLESSAMDSEALLRTSRSLSKFKEGETGDRILEEQSRRYIEILRQRLREAISRGESFHNQGDVLVARGFLWYYRDNLEKALVEWEKAQILNPGDPLLREQVEWVSRKKAMLEREQTMKEVLEQAREASAKGQSEQALLYWRTLVIMEPDNKDFQKRLVGAQDNVRRVQADKKIGKAYRFLRQGLLAEASSAFLEVLEVDPGNKESLDSLKDIQQSLNKRLERRAKDPAPPARPDRREPKLSEDHYTLGVVHFAKGELDKAMAAFALALEYDPANDRAKNALARIKAEASP